MPAVGGLSVSVSRPRVIPSQMRFLLLSHSQEDERTCYIGEQVGNGGGNAETRPHE